MSPPPDQPSRRNPLRVLLLAVIAIGLVALGGGLAVALDLGADDGEQPNAVDVGFARDMAKHHLQGVEMANAVLDISEDPAVRGLAFDIGTTQTNQVGRMQGWLTLWGENISGGEVMSWMDSHDMAGGHAGHSSADGALMPGMATEAELAELRTLRGSAFDVQFLRLMLRHHQGGLDMAEYAEANAGTAAVRDLASSIAESQSAEADLMVGMLAERGATPLPAP